MTGPVDRIANRFAAGVLRRVPPLWLARVRRVLRSRPSALTPGGWVYVGMLLTIFCGARLRDSNALLILGGMLTGPLLFSWRLPRRALSRLDAQRQAPTGIAATEDLVVELTATNRLRWFSAWTVEVEDFCRYAGPLAGVDTAPGKVLFPYLAPRGSCRADYAGQPPVRGRYRFGPLRLTTLFPLGLVRHRRWIDAPAELIVWPRLGRLTTAGLRLARNSDLAAQRTRRRQVRSEVDFHGLRDWRPGDSRRWIHWRSTARRGQLVVRQFDAARGHDVALFLDLWKPSSAGNSAACDRLVETALSFAATLVADICRRGGCRLRLVIGGEELFRLEGRASAGTAREALAGLAMARPRMRPQLPAELIAALAATPALWTMVLISTRAVDPADLSSGREFPLAQSTIARIQAIAVGTPQLAHYFLPPAAAGDPSAPAHDQPHSNPAASR